MLITRHGIIDKRTLHEATEDLLHQYDTLELCTMLSEIRIALSDKEARPIIISGQHIDLLKAFCCALQKATIAGFCDEEDADYGT